MWPTGVPPGSITTLEEYKQRNALFSWTIDLFLWSKILNKTTWLFGNGTKQLMVVGILQGWVGDLALQRPHWMELGEYRYIYIPIIPGPENRNANGLWKWNTIVLEP